VPAPGRHAHHRGWVVKTRTRLPVFDAEELGIVRPADPALANGFHSAEELAEQNLLGLYTCYHGNPGELAFLPGSGSPRELPPGILVSSRGRHEKEKIMSDLKLIDMDRRTLLTRLVPACSFACLSGAGLFTLAADGPQDEGTETVHKFDSETTQTMTLRQSVQGQYAYMIRFIKTLQSQMDETELVRLLNLFSSKLGQDIGTRQAQNSPDTSFQTFVATFRPPRYAESLTHTVVKDTEKIFELRVTECIWATVFREQGLGGKIGHAAVCNMDYYWPRAFNSNFKMERDKTLMEGHDCCNHRYVDTA